MGKKARRFYTFTYNDTDEPVYVEDAGSLLKISGILLQGMGTNILVLTPQANAEMVEAVNQFSVEIDGKLRRIELVQPPPDEWSEIIRRTDDPLWFEKDETGMTKAAHRKVRMAISGAVQQRIWWRDSCRCLLCGRWMGQVQLSVDHWIPLELGGANNETNYVTACRKCNKRKGNREPMEFCANELGWNAELLNTLDEYIRLNGNCDHTPDFIADEAAQYTKFPKRNPTKPLTNLDT